MLAIPAPKLWTPRRGPWWRLPRFDSAAMAHLKKSAATGHLLKTATGHLTKGCAACDWCALTTIRLVFSGVTGNGACYDHGFGSYTFDYNQTLDGTYDTALTGTTAPSGCLFKDFPTLNYAMYNRSIPPPCSSYLYQTTDDQIFAEIDAYGTSLNIRAEGTGGNSFLWFNGTLSLPASCGTSHTINNSLTSASGNSGYGGTCEITPIP